MFNKKLVIIVLIIFLSISIGSYSLYFFLKKDNQDASIKEKNFQQESLFPNADKNDAPPIVEENKYYSIYVRKNKDNDNASSFVPLTLNPGFKNDQDYNISTSIDDNGNIINDEKTIVVDNFQISKENKAKIKQIVGESKYDEAIKEIQERMLEIKEENE